VVALWGATVVVVVGGAGECTLGALVDGTVVVVVVVVVTPPVVGGAADVGGAGAVVVEVVSGFVVVVGNRVMVNPPPGLGSTNTPWEELAASVRTATQRAPKPTNSMNSKTVVRRILIRSETGPRNFDTMFGNFAINEGSERWGERACVSAPA
jgi:hypothetical protein